SSDLLRGAAEERARREGRRPRHRLHRRLPAVHELLHSLGQRRRAALRPRRGRVHRGARRHSLERGAAVIGWLLILGLLALLAVERLRAPKAFRAADTAVNLWTFGGYLLVSLVWGPLLFQLYAAVHDHALLDFGPHWLDAGSPRFWATWLALFVLDDFTFYWFHRCS